MRIFRKIIHSTICWYLRRCGKAFHCYSYGLKGRYVVLMNDRQYHRYAALAEDNDIGERLLLIEQTRKNTEEE